MEAFDLALNIFLVERRAIDGLRRAAPQAEHAPNRQAFRHSQAAPEALRSLIFCAPAQSCSSPNLLSNNAQTAVNAAASSAPSTVNSNSVPRAAASSNTLKIDFA